MTRREFAPLPAGRLNVIDDIDNHRVAEAKLFFGYSFSHDVGSESGGLRTFHTAPQYRCLDRIDRHQRAGKAFCRGEGHGALAGCG